MKNQTYNHIADQIGVIDVRLAALQAERKALKDVLVATGKASFAGELYQVTLITSDRHTLDMKAVRAKLSPQFIAAHTNVTSVTQMHSEVIGLPANVTQVKAA